MREFFLDLDYLSRIIRTFYENIFQRSQTYVEAKNEWQSTELTKEEFAG